MTLEPASSAGGRPPRAGWRALCFALLAGTALTAAICLPVRAQFEELLTWAHLQGPWGALWAGLAYVPATLLGLPCTLLTWGSGYLFGAWPTFAAVTVGANLGTTLALVLGRSLLRPLVERWAVRHPRFASFYQALARDGFRTVLLLRLSPVFPYNALNYALGLTRVSVHKTALATLLGMLPGTLMNCFLGASARSLSEVLAGRLEPSPAQHWLLAVGLAASLAVAVLAARAARRALHA